MKLLSRTEFPTLSQKTTSGIVIATARENRVVYLIGAVIDTEQFFLLSKGQAKGFKTIETASKALRDAGFEEYMLTIEPSAQTLINHQRETLAFFDNLFSEFGSLRAFADEQNLSYEDVLGVVGYGRRLRPVQVALAKHVNKDPKDLWPDFKADA